MALTRNLLLFNLEQGIILSSSVLSRNIRLPQDLKVFVETPAMRVFGAGASFNNID
jgi:hypothetical protein